MSEETSKKQKFPHQWKENGRFSHQQPRKLFFRFLLVFGFIMSFFFVGVGGVALLIRRITQDPTSSRFVWLAGCLLPIFVVMFVSWMVRTAFRQIARPLSEIMSAADAVAEGDLSVRVNENGSNEFNRLAKSFNHMTAQLEMADEQRRNLTADVAHELRTPLHIIQGNLEGVLDGVYEPTAAHIEDTLEETQLLARLAEDLRTLSLAESGHLELQMESVAVAELLADLETSFAGQAEGLGVGLQVERGERPFTVHGDADRLNQLLSNLMVNALRHTPSGGQIIVSIREESEMLHISLSDTGVGIDEASLPHVFDRFWKADKSRSGAGSGLGLAICKQLASAHGGTISVESRVGEGSTFTVSLPLAEPT